MAMEALRNLVNKIPEWQSRLEDLTNQIERRQAALGSMARPDAASIASPRPLRNKGSSESLKPKDDGPMHPASDVPLVDVPVASSQNQRNRQFAPIPSTPPGEARTSAMLSPSSGSGNPAGLHEQARETVATHAEAVARAKKMRKPSSVASAEGVPPIYRARSMIIVYYDSYVQGAFDELVRFISSSRNLMRKAKMAAKVAQIKRMAEMEIANDATGASDERLGVDVIPSLRFMSTRRLIPASKDNLSGEPSRWSAPEQLSDVYDCLDKSLEFVQSTCEHGAHQFLRDADCYDEISKIQARLVEVLASARQELDRIEREEPELANETGEMGKARMHRPISVRRDMAADRKDDVDDAEKRLTLEISPSKDSSPLSAFELEVDPDLDDENMDTLPVLQYRSTRLMRNRPI